jgi:RND family efflux transporter MFP subunit
MTIAITGTHVKTVLACALILSLTSCGKTNAAGENAANAAGAPPLVPVAKAARADLASNVVLTAEFQPFQQVDLMAKVAGYVRSIKVDIGDRVREGQVLATLEIPEMEDDLARGAAAIDQAEAEIATASDELHRAEAVHDLAHLSYNRIADVLKREPGLVPQQEVDEARSRDLIAEAQVSAAKSGLRTAEQRARVARAEQTRVQTLHNYMTITAPFDGVVTKRYANEGSMIQAGTASQTQAMPIVQLSQNNLLRLILPVPESAVSRVHVGGTVDVRVSSLARTFPGRVARFAGDIQQSTRTMDTEVDVPNPSLTLIPGMYAEVDLRVDERRDALTVPLDAVDRNGGSARVYTVTPSGAIHIVAVSLGLEDDRRVEVRSGLRDGDVVVVGRRTALKDGQQVQTKLLVAQVQ